MQEGIIIHIYIYIHYFHLIYRIGISVQNIRASQSYIRGTNGISNGLVPMLRVFNDTARYVDQGGGI